MPLGAREVAPPFQRAVAVVGLFDDHPQPLLPENPHRDLRAGLHGRRMTATRCMDGTTTGIDPDGDELTRPRCSATDALLGEVRLDRCWVLGRQIVV